MAERMKMLSNFFVDDQLSGFALSSGPSQNTSLGSSVVSSWWAAPSVCGDFSGSKSIAMSVERRSLDLVLEALDIVRYRFRSKMVE